MEPKQKLALLLKDAVITYTKEENNCLFVQKELDNKDNINPNITSLCLRKNKRIQGEKRKEYQDIFLSFEPKKHKVFSKPEGQYSDVHLNRVFSCSVYPDTGVRKTNNLSKTSDLLHNNRKIGVDIVQNPSIHCEQGENTCSKKKLKPLNNCQ